MEFFWGEKRLNQMTKEDWEEYEAQYISRLDQWERQAKRDRQRLITNLVKEEKISPQFGELLSQIQTSTGGGQEGANFEKVRIVMDLRDIFKSFGLAKERIVYTGSGKDWQFPVALGAREIDMVDPIFGEEMNIRRLLGDIRRVDPHAKITETPPLEIGFHLDLGQGQEAITLRLYAVGEDDYCPQELLGGVLEYLGVTNRPNPLFLAPVVPNVARHTKEGALIANFDFRLEEGNKEEGVEALRQGEYYIYKVTSQAELVNWSLKSRERKGKPIPYAHPNVQ